MPESPPLQSFECLPLLDDDAACCIGFSACHSACRPQCCYDSIHNAVVNVRLSIMDVVQQVLVTTQESAKVQQISHKI
jgi:hypothetical protein